MANSKSVYDAKVEYEAMRNNKIPPYDEVVKNIILSSNTELKKERIDRAICKQIGLKLDSSITHATANALLKLESKDIIQRGSKRGYWVKC